ncbi:hypothetical protein ACLOJK_009990 [Asimina triloba]
MYATTTDGHQRRYQRAATHTASMAHRACSVLHHAPPKSDSHDPPCERASSITPKCRSSRRPSREQHPATSDDASRSRCEGNQFRPFQREQPPPASDVHSRPTGIRFHDPSRTHRSPPAQIQRLQPSRSTDLHSSGPPSAADPTAGVFHSTIRLQLLHRRQRSPFPPPTIPTAHIHIA